MAEVIVQRACAKLRSAIGDEAVVRSNFIGDLRYMLGALESIQPVLERAEMEPFRSIPVARWLQLACSAACKTIDTVNELHDARPQAAATLTRMLPHLAIVKNAMAIEVQETKKLVMRADEERPSRFPNYYTEITEEPKTRPVSEEAMIFGRGSDKERIIAALLCSTEPNITQEHITILPIYGLEGSGKTTLAQMVFNGTHSLQGYDFRVWFHVSPQLDFHALGNSIICHVLERRQEASDMEGMEGIMKRLHELLHRKKVLLILDDLWEEDSIQLQLLKSMLTFLGDKMDVIVTTSNQAIARNICTVEPYRLNRLSDDTCWEIIKKSIGFEGGEEELEKIGREIASKCCGVPLVAQEYASILHFSSRDAITWKKFMEWSIWSIIMKSISSRVWLSLARFELSYRSMPPDLRLCFAYYCAVFPTGHNIVKDDLVHQWIALHLIEPSETLSAAQIAEEHITRLQNMSFLQTAELDHTPGPLLMPLRSTTSTTTLLLA
ncbi:hypothetical protein CFC21_027365 [Triticum aestivum]|uniref:NB-ARC domain-containing protein n=2 Tax=Triticum aestivum TaxID=4565 RepID=A0A9R1JD99_WHEAT|nr:disease resistance protein RGA2-like isoform X1 [Triticum aestivum]XP_044329887.1 disease resistance protein RGA2-like isoform X2 [Triticum aestivum]KAF7013271.1 hypothetical protein CFC21_027365 [Triticum aestivum]